MPAELHFLAGLDSRGNTMTTLKIGLLDTFLAKIGSLSGPIDERINNFLICGYARVVHGSREYNPRNYDPMWREATEVLSRHGVSYFRTLDEMLDIVRDGLKTGEGDFLGEALCALGGASPHPGSHLQYVTPYEVAAMMARISMEGAQRLITEKGFLTCADNDAGSGSGLIACARSLKAECIDPARHFFVEAEADSLTSFRMAYIQLGLMGLPAIVSHIDRKTGRARGRATPAMMPFSRQAGAAFTSWLNQQNRRCDTRRGQPWPATIAWPEQTTG